MDCHEWISCSHQLPFVGPFAQPPSVCFLFFVLNLFCCCSFCTSCQLLAEYPGSHQLTTDDLMVPAIVLPLVQVLVAIGVLCFAARPGSSYSTAHHFSEHGRGRFAESTLGVVSAPSFPPSLEVDNRVCWPTVLDLPLQRSTASTSFSLALNQRLRPSLAPGRGCAASLTEMRISKNLPSRPARCRVGLAHDQGPAMQRRDTSQPPCVSSCGRGSGPCPPGGHVSHCASAMATPARPHPSLGHDQRRRPGAQAHACT